MNRTRGRYRGPAAGRLGQIRKRGGIPAANHACAGASGAAAGLPRDGGAAKAARRLLETRWADGTNLKWNVWHVIASRDSPWSLRSSTKEGSIQRIMAVTTAFVALPPPDSQKERAYITDKVHSRYWHMPQGLPWIGVPLLGIVTYVATADKFRSLIPIYLTAAAVVIAVMIAYPLTTKIPNWNRTRRADVETRARAEFNERYTSFKREYEAAIATIQRFRDAVDTRSYNLYVERARAANPRKLLDSRHAEGLFDSTPTVITKLQESMEILVQEVESDPCAVGAYRPDLLTRIESLENRAAAGNILDTYRATKDIEEILTELEERGSPFDFAMTASLLRERVQQCRDEILADPNRETVWRDIEHKDLALNEKRRHNRAMEEAAEAEAEAAREQAQAAREQVALAQERNERLREQNKLLREQRNAQIVTAAGTTATALYTRKAANALRDMSDDSTSN